MPETGQEQEQEQADECVVTALSEEKSKEAAWHERGQVLLEQVEAICKRGRARQLSYMQAVVELEALRIGRHLESKPRLSSLAASRAVIQYQGLMKLLDEGRKLPGWGQEHEALMVEALDIAFFRMSDHEHERYERKRAEEQAGGFIAACSDRYYTEELAQLAGATLENSKLAGRPFEAVFFMGFYPCPTDSAHGRHAPAVCAAGGDGDVRPDLVQFIAERMHSFASELEAQLAVYDEALESPRNFDVGREAREDGRVRG